MKKPVTSNIDVVCAKCGSRDVRRNGDAAWNVATQKWELCAVFDQGYCEECEDEAQLIEVAVQGPKALVA